MVKRCDRFVKKIKNSFYYKTVMIYSLILMTIMIVTSLLFIKLEKKNFQYLQAQQEQIQVIQFKDFTEQYILQNAYTLVTKELFLLSGRSNEMINDEMAYIHNQNDYSKALELQKFITSLTISRDYIDSISIYHKKYDTLISSKHGVFYDTQYKKDKYEELINYKLLNKADIAENNSCWVSVKENKDFYKDKNIATLVKLLPMYAMDKEIEIVVYINIDMDKAYKSYFSHTNVNNDGFIIVDSSGQIIYDTCNEAKTIFEYESSIYNSIEESDSGRLLLPNNRGTLNWDISGINDWKYIYFSSDLTVLEEMTQSIKYILMGYILGGILLFICIIRIERWLCKPLKNLVILSSQRLQGQSSEDGDLSTIMKAFTHIDDKMDKLEMIVEKNHGLILNHIIRELLGGKISSKEELNERLKLINEETSYELFYILMIRVGVFTNNNLNYKEKDFIYMMINEMIGQQLNQLGKVKLATQFDYDEYITCVINIDTMSAVKLQETIEAALIEIKTKLQVDFNIVLSMPLEEVSEFSKHIDSMRQGFKYSYLYGNEKVFIESEILEYENNIGEISKCEIERIGINLKKQKFKEAKVEIAEIFTAFKERKCSYAHVKNIIIQIISIVSQISREYNIKDEVLMQQNLLKEYAKIESSKICNEWINEIIDTLQSHILLRNNNMEGSVVEKVISYIRENVNDQLSLNTVADHFNLSTGHLSRIFKEKAGINFSDYLSDIKFEKAIALLITEPKKKVTKISEELGYSNVTYFTKVFKEKYGMTPTQYRKVHLTSDEERISDG